MKHCELTGLEVELANHILATLKLKPEWKTGEFKSHLIGLDKGQYDITVASLAILLACASLPFT